MTLTLLIDLDNTLLGNPMETFLPAYISRLAEAVSPLVHPDKFVPILLAATESMVNNTNPRQVLKQVFDEHFFPALCIESEIAQPYIDRFYSEIYPSLQPVTESKPSAVALIKDAVSRGYQIAIATNPLFPFTAIEQRLIWAGINPDDYPLAHITSYDTSHFAKPNTAYYTEILANLGWPEGPILMIGDDIERDLIPCQQLGIPTFWINPNSENPGHFSFIPTGMGTLDRILPWIDEIGLEKLQPSFDTTTAITATLVSTVSVIQNMLSRSSEEEDLLVRPAPGELNLREIIFHLRDVEEKVNFPRLEAIAAGDNPFIVGVDTDSWFEEYPTLNEDPRTAFEAFCKIRAKTIDLLSNLDDQSWKLPARHSIFGPTTIKEMAGIMAGHDKLHIRQIHNR